MGLIYQITIFVTNNCKKKKVLEISENERFLVESVDILQSNRNSDFKENALKEYFKNGDGSWFDTYIYTQTLYFLDRPLFESSHGTC